MSGRVTKRCPVCQSNHKTNKLVLRQINLTTAVYLCEDQHCSYPEGYGWIEVNRSLDELFLEKQQSTGDTDLDEWLDEMFDKETASNGCDYDDYVSELSNDFNSDDYVTSRSDCRVNDGNKCSSESVLDDGHLLISNKTDMLDFPTRNESMEDVSKMIEELIIQQNELPSSEPDDVHENQKMENNVIKLSVTDGIYQNEDVERKRYGSSTNEDNLQHENQETESEQIVNQKDLRNDVRENRKPESKQNYSSSNEEDLPRTVRQGNQKVESEQNALCSTTEDIIHENETTKRKIVIQIPPSVQVPTEQQTRALLRHLPFLSKTTVIKVVPNHETASNNSTAQIIESAHEN